LPLDSVTLIRKLAVLVYNSFMPQHAVVAALTESVYKDFLAPLSGKGDYGFKMLHCPPENGYLDLVNLLQSSKSEVLITGWGSPKLPGNFLLECPTVCYVCHLTGELRWLMPRSLIEEGLLVSNWGNSITDTIAEAALFMILACLRRAVETQMHMHLKAAWREEIGEPRSLFGRRVGLHGLGNIARNLVG
jgi:phosphoglycerate dehydrogenase-like enzyme